jgi:hypothetical protein
MFQVSVMTTLESTVLIMECGDYGVHITLFNKSEFFYVSLVSLHISYIFLPIEYENETRIFPSPTTFEKLSKEL